MDNHEMGATQLLAEARKVLEFESLEIPPLRVALSAKKDAWSASHGGAPFPATVALAFDAADDLLLVKSIAFTAADAGFPHLQIVVRSKDGRLGVLPIDAAVPASKDDPIDPDEYLVAQVDARTASAFWQKRGEPHATSLGAPTAFASVVKLEWSAHGLHRSSADQKSDQAFLFADRQTSVESFTSAVAALLSVSRERETSGRLENVPALKVMLMMAARTADPEHVTMPVARPSRSQVNGRLPPEVIQTIVRQNFGTLRKCYEAGLARDRNLAGKVETKFVIGRDGKVSSSAPSEGTTLEDAAVTSCVAAEFAKLTFPAPEGGIVTVVYPVIFSPSP